MAGLPAAHTAPGLGLHTARPRRTRSLASHTRPWLAFTPPSVTTSIVSGFISSSGSSRAPPDPALEIDWARDVFMLVNRVQQSASRDIPPFWAIQDPHLLRLVQIASAQHPTPMPIFGAEAIYLRITFLRQARTRITSSPRVAFRDFEQAVRAGYAQAWFRLGRDYENFNDATLARDHSLQVPQPIYVYGLLLGEFSHVIVSLTYLYRSFPRTRRSSKKRVSI